MNPHSQWRLYSHSTGQRSHQNDQATIHLGLGFHCCLKVFSERTGSRNLLILSWNTDDHSEGDKTSRLRMCASNKSVATSGLSSQLLFEMLSCLHRVVGASVYFPDYLARQTQWFKFSRFRIFCLAVAWSQCALKLCMQLVNPSWFLDHLAG